MHILQDQSEVTILCQWPCCNQSPQRLIEKAGRNCYLSETDLITDESAAKFTSMIASRQHWSVIEHVWFGAKFTDNSYPYLDAFDPYHKHLYLTRANHHAILSGNLETWRKIYHSGLLAKHSLSEYLQQWVPQIFTKSNHCENALDLPTAYPVTLNDLTDCADILNHCALTAKFSGDSRGLTHELVRHRLINASQTSTRYVDFAKGGTSPDLNRFEMNVIMPPHQDINKLVDMGNGKKLTPREMAAEVETFYRSLRKAGWPPEDARQILPIGIEAPIVVTCNLQEWHYIFSKRTAKEAHWEIRSCAIKLLQQMQKEFPNVFNDFVPIGEDKNSVPYYGIKP